ATAKNISGSHSMIVVHNVHTDEADLQWAMSESLPPLFWCVCPGANLYIGNGLPDISLMKRYGARMVIGTDSLASNEQLDLLEEIRILQKHFTGLQLDEL